MTGVTGKRFLLLYGSQTGQAQAICEEIADRAPQHGLRADLHCLSQTEKKFCLEREKLAVIVISTTGDGEVPDTAHKFWRRLKKTTLPSTHLKNLQYSLLGLGDSNYTNFCNCGRMVDKRLQELGAKTFHPVAWADDAVGLDVAADPWIDGLLETLSKKLSLSSETSPSHRLTTNTNSNCNEKTVTHNGSLNDAAVLTDSPLINGNIDSNSINLNETGTDSDNVSNRKSNTDVKTQISSNDSSENVNVSQAGDSSKAAILTVESATQTTHTVTIATDGINDVTKDQTVASLGHSVPPLSESALSLPVTIATDGINDVRKDQTIASLGHSVPPLSESALSLPVLPDSYLKISYNKEQSVDLSSIPYHNGAAMPSAKTDVSLTTIVKAIELTSKNAMKKALHITLDIKEAGWTYEPGDSFGIICTNPADEVNALLARLHTDADAANGTYDLSVIEGTKKRNAAVPSHIPETGTLFHTLCHCCDIRTPPKKAFVRALVEHTSNEGEKRRLQELASKQGAEDYSRYIREAHVSLLDLLQTFPSCNPSIETVLEHLPRLQPRAYSACSSQRVSKNEVSFVFNVVEFEGQAKVAGRRGVCTGWLDDLTRSVRDQGSLGEKLNTLGLEDLKIPAYMRSNQYFHAPTDLSVPVVMIGPGTGVAPYIGFLQDRAERLKEHETTDNVGETWLFFGCRHEDRDYLFRKELEDYQKIGVLTHLLVSFSRDSPEDSSRPRYVQDNLLLHSSDLYKLLSQHKAAVYVCGDARNMAKGVMQAFVAIYQNNQGLSAKDAELEVMQLKLQRRYLEDVWA